MARMINRLHIGKIKKKKKLGWESLVWKKGDLRWNTLKPIKSREA